MEKIETEIGKTIKQIRELYVKILEKNNGVFPEDMPCLEIEMPPFYNGD